MNFIPSKVDKNYPAVAEIEKNSVVICLDSIRNKIELKENLDRELSFLHHLKTHKPDTENDK